MIIIIITLSTGEKRQTIMHDKERCAFVCSLLLGAHVSESIENAAQQYAKWPSSLNAIIFHTRTRDCDGFIFEFNMFALLPYILCSAKSFCLVSNESIYISYYYYYGWYMHSEDSHIFTYFLWKFRSFLWRCVDD